MTTPFDQAVQAVQDDNALTLHSVLSNSSLSIDNLSALLILATQLKKSGLVSTLLESGADIGWRNAAGKSALEEAIKSNQAPIINQFMARLNVIDETQRSTMINTPDNTGNTLLMHAAKNLNFTVTDALIAYGADRSLANTQGETAFSMAEEASDGSRDTDFKINRLQTDAPLIEAVEQGDLLKVEMLLNQSVDAKVLRFSDNRSLLLIALENKNPQTRIPIMELLIQHGADIHARYKKATVLWWAISLEEYEAIDLLLKQPSIDPNLGDDSDGETPLIKAIEDTCKNNEYIHQVVSKLLNHPRVDLNRCKNNSRSVLYSALRNTDKKHLVSTVEQLIKQGTVCDFIFDGAGRDLLGNRGIPEPTTLLSTLRERTESINPKYRLEPTIVEQLTTCLHTNGVIDLDQYSNTVHKINNFINKRIKELERTPYYVHTDEKLRILRLAQTDFQQLTIIKIGERCSTLSANLTKAVETHFNPENVMILKQRRALFQWIADVKDVIIGFINKNRSHEHRLFQPATASMTDRIQKASSEVPQQHQPQESTPRKQ